MNNPFEKPTVQKDTRLGVEEARELANMQRAELETIPGSNISMKDWRMEETTAEDYDKALATIEELQELAAKEPATEKVLAALARSGERAKHLVMNVISTGWYARIDFDEKMRLL